MSEIKHSLGYRPDIDGLRTLAVLSVLLFHFDFKLFSGGFVGVDIFFVISGFLITKILVKEFNQTRNISIKNFYIRRARRILPAYISTIFFSVLIGIFCFSPSHFQKFGESLIASVFMVSNLYFFFEADYFDISSRYKPLLHLWSLSIEEQFYIFWPLILIFVLKVRKVRTQILIFTSIAAISLLLNLIVHFTSYPILSSLLQNKGEGSLIDIRPELFFLLPYRIFEFMIGAALVFLPKTDLKNYWRQLLFLLGLGASLVAILSFHEGMIFPSYFALLPCLGAALMIYSEPRGSVSFLFTNWLFVNIGKISYSLYMIHWPLFVYSHYMGLFDGPNALVHKIIVILLSLLLSVLSYRFVELPFRLNQKTFFSRFYFTPLILTILLLLGVGIDISQSGWYWRSNIGNIQSDPGYFHLNNYGGTGYRGYRVIKKNQNTKVILLGDSHGLQYAEGLFKEFVEPHNLSFYNASGTSCFHLPNFTRKTKGHDWDKICPRALNRGLAFLSESEEKNIVVISHSWASQMKNGGQLTQKDQPLTASDLKEGIANLKKLIGNTPLVVLGNVPTTQSVDIFSEITRPKLLPFQEEGIEKFRSTDLNKINKSIVDFNESIKLDEKLLSQIVFLDPFDVLCDQKNCLNILGEEVLYSDTTHLSKTGSQYVIRQFLPQLESILESLNKQ